MTQRERKKVENIQENEWRKSNERGTAGVRPGKGGQSIKKTIKVIMKGNFTLSSAMESNYIETHVPLTKENKTSTPIETLLIREGRETHRNMKEEQRKK